MQEGSQYYIYESFETADKLRNPVIILADGYDGTN
jgi:pyruvate/2-oxoacid:ferredoxin oxidoreductase alpha subunit